MIDKSVGVTWPNGAKVAVVLQMVFEQWQGQDVEQSYLPKVIDSHLASGGRDLLNESFQRYAGKTGMWRIIDTLDRYGVTATGVMNGLSIERFPEVAKAFTNGGREIAAHSWAQDVLSYSLTKDEERDNIRRCVDVTAEVTGQTPVGWVSPRGQASMNTAELLVDEGFLWHTDYSDDDAPYVLDVGGKPLVAMAGHREANDATGHVPASNPPSAYVEIFCRSLDILRREGGQLIGAVVHATAFGRPHGIWALEQSIEYAQSFPDVWIASRREIAEWVLSQQGA
jgi:peptidoglycan/xylan/chitin deacetylase (PgdA/CDA1 family)